MMQIYQEHGQKTKQVRAPRLGAEAWAAHRSAIEQLYSKENRRLKDVMHLMRQRHGFCASRRQYEYHLALWKVSKYSPRTATSGDHLAPVHNSRTSTTGIPLTSFHDLSDGSNLEPEDSELPDASIDLTHSVGGTSTDFIEMSNLLPPMMWDETFDFIEQELAALNDKDNNHSGRESVTDSSLAQFSDCRFTDLDHRTHQHHHHHHDDTHALLQPVAESEHRWQTPGALSRLWELETPASQRTEEQRCRVQKMMWCLWLCGNQDCFTNLARGVQYRIVRVQDDIARFESNVETWIHSSTGCPSSISSSHVNIAHHDRFDGFGASFAGGLARRTSVENGIGSWQKHAALGHQLAMLKATGKTEQAKKLALRLASDLDSAPGRWAFFSSITIILRLIQRCLVKEISTLRLLESDVRSFVKAAVEVPSEKSSSVDTLVDEKKAVGVISYLCYHRWTQNTGYSSEREAYIEASTGFPIAKVFQWLTRLLIFHSKRDGRQSKRHKAPAPILFSPSSLCSRALNGLSAISLFEHSDLVTSRDDKIHADKLAMIWLDWLSRDSEWFLPSLLPMDLADSSTNVWQSIPQ